MIHETFKSALHANVFDTAVPAKQLADKVGKSYTYLANAANPEQFESHFQAKDIIPLTLASGSFALLDFIEHSVGRVSFQIPHICGEVSAVAAELSLVTSEFSDLLHEVSEAIKPQGENGSSISRRECRRIEQECDHLITELCRLRAAVREEADR